MNLIVAVAFLLSALSCSQFSPDPESYAGGNMPVWKLPGARRGKPFQPTAGTAPRRAPIQAEFVVHHTTAFKPVTKRRKTAAEPKVTHVPVPPAPSGPEYLYPNIHAPYRKWGCELKVSSGEEFNLEQPKAGEVLPSFQQRFGPILNEQI